MRLSSMALAVAAVVFLSFPFPAIHIASAEEGNRTPLSAVPDSVPEDILAVVEKNCPAGYEISHWVHKPWVVADLNGNGNEEIVVLLRDTAKSLDHGKAYPTHVAIFEEKDGATVGNNMIKLEEGMPVQNEDSFQLIKKLNALKEYGCSQPTAIEFYEEAGTTFYLCMGRKDYRFFRDLDDEP